MNSSAAAAGFGQIHSVFVYGSLLADEVVDVLLSRLPDSCPATLSGFHRFSIRHRVYPAIIPVVEKEVPGKILFGITDKEMLVLDEFEDVEYDRRSVTVTLEGTETMPLEAFTYIWRDKQDPNLYGDWNFEEWRKIHLDDFLKMSTAFMEELELTESSSRVAIYESQYQEADGDDGLKP